MFSIFSPVTGQSIESFHNPCSSQEQLIRDKCLVVFREENLEKEARTLGYRTRTGDEILSFYNSRDLGGKMLWSWRADTLAPPTGSGN